jgi:hypothetical protein
VSTAKGLLLKLKLAKYYLMATIAQERTGSLSIAADATNIHFNDSTADSARTKSRKFVLL